MAQKTQTRRILILGANGKLGKMVFRALAADGSEQLDLLAVSRSGDTGLRWSPEESAALLPGADHVVALWGVTPAHSGDLSDNAALALRAMEVAASVGADRVLHCSSAAVYATDGQWATEEDVLRPASAYGRAKQEMEEALSLWQKDHPAGPKPVCLRIGNMAGADSLFAALAGGTVTLDRFADGQGPRRSYIAPGDLARVIVALCRAPVGDLWPVYNVAAPGLTEMAALARAAGCDVTWRRASDTAVQTAAMETRRLQTICQLEEQSAHADRIIADWRMWSDAA